MRMAAVLTVGRRCRRGRPVEGGLLMFRRCRRSPTAQWFTSSRSFPGSSSRSVLPRP
jgi:hypothetical protein